MKKNKYICKICNLETSKPIICDKCVLKDENRKKVGLKVSSDYVLAKDDYVLNSLCFLHACGSLNDFLDKTESENTELMMSTWSNRPDIPDSVMNQGDVLCRGINSSFAYQKVKFQYRTNSNQRKNNNGN